MADRKKQVKAPALLKMETFLNDVYLKIGKGDTFSLDALAREHKLSGSIATLLKRTNIVQKLSTNTWAWLYSKAPERDLALTMLDEINRYNGNWNKGAIPHPPQEQKERTLFDPVASVSERVYLAGCIATGIYSNVDISLTHLNEEAIEKLNERITFVANNLINTIYKPKSQTNE